MAEHSPVEIVRHASTLSILWGVLLIVFGILAVGSPFLAAVAVNVVIAWLIILAGVVHVILAFHAHRAGRLIWKLLVGLAYLFFGAYLIMHPVLGVASLTLVLASLFLIEGILDIVLFFRMRSIGGSSWVLVDGVITRFPCGQIVFCCHQFRLHLQLQPLARCAVQWSRFRGKPPTYPTSEHD